MTSKAEAYKVQITYRKGSHLNGLTHDYIVTAYPCPMGEFFFLRLSRTEALYIESSIISSVKVTDI